MFNLYVPIHYIDKEFEINPINKYLLYSIEVDEDELDK
jgi:hypothetical protein